MKLGTWKIFSRTKLGKIEILPIWVTMTLKELGRLIFIGTGRGDKEIKAIE